MVDHGAREHAEWAPSAAAANIACSGRLALIDELAPVDKESEAAAWGTACHQVSEKCLRSGKDAAELMGTVEQTKSHPFEVDEEMAETAQTYVDYVRSYYRDTSILWIEQKFSLAELDPPFSAGGTADAVVYLPDEKRLVVIDLKGGRGVVVEAKGNVQLRHYALGAYLRFRKEVKIRQVTVVIVQPRAPHKDGRIRSETFHGMELLEWTEGTLRPAWTRSKQAMEDRKTMPSAAWETEYLCAGPHCKFCPVAGICPAIERKVADAVGLWFDDLDAPHLQNAPEHLSPEERAKTLDLLDMIEEWVSARRAWEHTMAEMGQPAAGYILVEKTGREKWVDDKAEKTVLQIAEKLGKRDAVLNKPKLMTPKQVAKALGKKAELLLDGLSTTPSTGTNLVRADKTSRSPVQSKVEQFFSPLD